MTATPVQLLVAVFDDEPSAEAALRQIQQSKGDSLAAIHGAVVLSKDLNRQIRTKDVGVTPGKGAAAGAALGAAVGILTGGAALVLGAAAGIVGGIVGVSKREKRVNSGSLNEIAVALAPGSSAVVLAVDESGADLLEQELEQTGAKVFKAIVAVDIAEELERQRKDGTPDALS